MSWDFIYGHKQVYDEEAKKKVLQCVSTPVYPPKPQLDLTLLPPLDATTAQVTWHFAMDYHENEYLAYYYTFLIMR